MNNYVFEALTMLPMLLTFLLSETNRFIQKLSAGVLKYSRKVGTTESF